MKLLFINAIDSSSRIETKYPPLGIGYLIGNLRKKFDKDEIEFRVIDDNIEYEIENFKPDIVGISSVTQNYKKAAAYARTAKKYNLPVLCGGVHISMCPSSFSGHMDIGVIGEGEETICDIVELFKRKGNFDKEDLKKIKGIIYWDNNKIVTTPKREMIQSLDELPYPSRDLFNINPNAYIFSSRGCPYHCSFCASTRLWNRVRLFSAEYVVGEIQHLVDKYNVKTITLYDDLFSVNPNRVKNIVNLLRERNILGRIRFLGSIRADNVNDEIISLLKEMGFTALGMGLESGSNNTLKYLKGENIDLKDNENAVKIIKKHKIFIHGGFIIGSPHETKKDVLETLNFIKKNGLTSYTVYLLTPFPGTPVWDYAKERGLVNENMDWEILNVDFRKNHDSAVIVSEKLTREELYKLFLRLMRYQKRKIFYNYIKKALLNPLKVPEYLLNNIIKHYREK